MTGSDIQLVNVHLSSAIERKHTGILSQSKGERVSMKEVTIKIDDEVYGFYLGIAVSLDYMSLEDVIAVAVREHYEWEVYKKMESKQ